MNERFRQPAVQIALIVLVFILQLVQMRLAGNFTQRIELLEYGMETFAFAAVATILGVVSGIILASLLLAQRKHDVNITTNNSPLLTVALLGIIPLLAIVFKLFIVSFGAFTLLPFSLLGPIWTEVYDWAVNSQVPAFWFGLVIGWLWKRG